MCMYWLGINVAVDTHIINLIFHQILISVSLIQGGANRFIVLCMEKQNNNK